MAFGTLNSFDTLATSQSSIVAYGEDNAFQAIQAQLDAHNAIMTDIKAPFIEMTTDRQRRYGGPDNMTMDEVDEFGRGDAQKIAAGVTLGFPLRLFDVSVQWTRKYFQNATGKELAAQFTAVTDAHYRRVVREIKKAIFIPTNNTAYVDRLTDGVTLALRKLLNADSQAIPIGPNGETFTASTHTHYLARVSTFAASDVTAVIDTVREHYSTGRVFLYINRAQESAVRAFTSNFFPYPYPGVVMPVTVARGDGTTDLSNPYNRAIGVFDGVEVWVKPWVPSGYMLAWIDTIKPLVMRERKAGGGNLVIAAEDEAYPLRAKTLEAEFGVGVWQRAGMAVLDVTDATNYVAPTLTD